jgi:hypothetical protein
MQPFRLSILLILSCCSIAVAEDKLAPKTEVADAQRAAHLKQMQEIAASIRLLTKSSEPDSAEKLKPEPILRYADNSRFNNESTLWIWPGSGRPHAVVAIELYPRHPKGPSWLYEIASLSKQRIQAERGDDLHWTAKEPGLKLRTLPDGKPVADKATRRLAQMKELCRRFTAHESAVIEGRVELRLMSSPLYRYSDSTAGVSDGAIFALANGTNPEVLLVLEARDSDEASPWQYALVQMTGGALVVELDGKEVWKCGEADPPAERDSYINGWLPAETKSKSTKPKE